jgi:hypothetical protein
METHRQTYTIRARELSRAKQRIGLHERALKAVAGLFEDAATAGMEPFHVSSGFRDRLQKDGGYEVILNNKSYSVRWVAASALSDDVVYVPQGMEFQLSNDNRGGYIISAWNSK